MLRLALAVLLPLTVAACSAGSQPAALNAEVPPPAPAGDSPESGVDATENADPEADPVEAAVREYVAAANVAMSTGDTTRFRQAVTPECTCLAFADSVEGRYSRGDSTPDARWEITEIKVADDSGSRATAIISLRQTAFRVLGSDGEVMDSIAASKFDSYVLLTGDSSLRVADVDEL